MKIYRMFSSMMFLACILLGTSCSSDDQKPETPEQPSTEETTPNDDTAPGDSMPEYHWQEAKAIHLSETETQVNHAMIGFAWRMYDIIQNSQENPNTFFSPMSLQACFTNLLNGVTGDTRAECLRIMGLSPEVGIEKLNTYFSTMSKGIVEADNMTRFATANALWYDEELTLNTSFAQATKEVFGTELFPVRFGLAETTEQINKWVAEHTYNRIQKMVELTTPEDCMHLLNTVYFRSNWATKFPTKLTAMRSFANATGQSVEVPTMHGGYASTAYTENNQYQLAILPFNNRAFGMFFILPAEGIAIKDLLHQFADEGPDMTSLGTVAMLEVLLPKFKAEGKIELTDVLRDMGAELLFSESSDFQLFERNNYALSAVTQKTYISIDEEGAEAAAATDMHILTSSGEEFESRVLNLNRPFLYGIVETSTGMPLFMGCQAKF